MTNLDMLSPLQTMLRGYSYVTIDDQIIKSTNDVDVKQVVNIHLSDGEVTAEIQEKCLRGIKMAKEKKQTFEEAMTDLEIIVKQLETGEVPLEEALEQFKRNGTK